MKLKNKCLFGGVCLAVIAFLAFFCLGGALNPGPEYNGERIYGADQFMLDFSAMNGVQTHTMPLKTGDRLQCSWRIDRGEVDVVIGTAETKIYQGNRIETGAFEVGIPADGDYTVSVKGSRAVGRIDVYRKEPCEEQQ